MKFKWNLVVNYLIFRYFSHLIYFIFSFLFFFIYYISILYYIYVIFFYILYFYFILYLCHIFYILYFYFLALFIIYPIKPLVTFLLIIFLLENDRCKVFFNCHCAGEKPGYKLSGLDERCAQMSNLRNRLYRNTFVLQINMHRQFWQ